MVAPHREDGEGVSLYAYFEQRFKDHLLVHDAEERERGNALDAVNERLASMNEFRAQASDRDNAFLTKSEFSAYRTGQQQTARWMTTTLIAVAGITISTVFGLFALMATR